MMNEKYENGRKSSETELTLKGYQQLLWKPCSVTLTTMATQTLKIKFPSLEIPQRPQRSLTTFISYSKQLEEFINKYKTRPRDIKFWPYGPYWPPYFENEVLDTPKLLNTCPTEREEFQLKINGKCARFHKKRKNKVS